MVKKGAHMQGENYAIATLEDRLVQNLVELQKVHTAMAEKFDKLSHQISELLALFELTARTFAKDVNIPNVEKDKEFLEKIDKLLDQNKVIAKGLTLMEEKMRERMLHNPSQASQSPSYQASPSAPASRAFPRL